jgi:hypothetical protein
MGMSIDGCLSAARAEDTSAGTAGRWMAPKAPIGLGARAIESAALSLKSSDCRTTRGWVLRW